MSRPVMYLDVDGVLWTIDETGYSAAPGLSEFMEFAFANYDVRWCTSWATRGTMRPERMQQLAEWTHLPVTLWRQVGASDGWTEYKTQCIDWVEVREGKTFVWIEDGLLDCELRVLRDNHIEDWYIYTNVLENPNALLETLAILKSRVAAPTEGA